jgi:hypothetical protein
MGQYICDRCNHPRHADEHGFHTTRRKGGSVDRCICDECFSDEVADPDELSTIDGKNLDDNFVCPECLAVLPVARLVQYRAWDDFASDGVSTDGQVCLACHETLFDRLKKRGIYVTWAADYEASREPVTRPE